MDDSAGAPVEPSGAAPEASPRAAFAAALATHMTRLLAAGDVDGARIAHEAMGRLLAAEGARGDAVVDLAAERRKRGER